MKLNRSENLKDQNSKKEKILETIRKLCGNRYVKIHDFPPSLRRKCVRHFGSVRAAKWQAGVIHDHRFNREDFLKHVCAFCKNRACEDKEWPANLKYWAKYFCGSVRKAKCEAGIGSDSKICKNRMTKRALTREDIIRWIREHSKEKVHFWPAHIIIHAEQYFGSVRQAKLNAGTVQDERRESRIEENSESRFFSLFLKKNQQKNL